ncbi:MAG: hypothetical protein C0616_03525 [Desulfuromonas sp.]|nr:MAG: hypothetical protein C0616_03525 [Desulfuromonas sp.]
MKKTMQPLFDTHIHLDCLAAGTTLEEELTTAKKAGVNGWLVPGVRYGGWDRLLKLAQIEAAVRIAPGLHPLAATEWDESVSRRLAALLQRPESVAVGEIGLDAMLPVARDVQERVFRAQLQLAIDHRKPVVIHCRKAYAESLKILREVRRDLPGGIMHAFGGSPELAKEAIDLGFGIGFGGTLTYPQARRAPEVLRAISEEWIVLETDAPDMSPHPFRREPNRPFRLQLVAEKVAEIKGWSLVDTAQVTRRNAMRILGLSEAAAPATLKVKNE